MKIKRTLVRTIKIEIKHKSFCDGCQYLSATWEYCNLYKTIIKLQNMNSLRDKSCLEDDLGDPEENH